MAPHTGPMACEIQKFGRWIIKVPEIFLYVTNYKYDSEAQFDISGQISYIGGPVMRYHHLFPQIYWAKFLKKKYVTIPCTL